MKQEMYYEETYRSFKELNKAVKEGIYYDNNKRIKVKWAGISLVKYCQHASLLAA